MGKFLIRNFALTILCLGICSGSWNTPALAGPDDKTAAQADQAFIAALNKGEKKPIELLLDTNFQWTDADGRTRDKEQALENLSSLAADNQGDADVKTHAYDQLVLIFGRHGKLWFSRTWVKRPEGWTLLVDLDTPMVTESTETPAARPNGPVGDCINPCKNVPFKPETADDKAVLAEWQKTKVDEWHPDADDWASHVSEDFLIISGRSMRNKEERVALAKKQQAAGIGSPGAPILTMSMSDFGNAVVMISRHIPYQGGKPYYNFRIFVNEDGHWPIAWSQQTTIQADAARTSAEAEK